MQAEHTLAKQWLAKARNDLLNADNNLQSEAIPFDTVCFHCQQAAEKLLKAYLVGKGRSYPFSHDLLMIYTPLDATSIYIHPAVPELVNLQNVKGQAKPYQVRQLLRLIERYNIQLQG